MLFKKIVGHNIRNYRKQKGWTMEKLAVRSKVNYDFLGHVERGESGLNVELLFKIAKALQIKPHLLLIKDSYKLSPEELRKEFLP